MLKTPIMSSPVPSNQTSTTGTLNSGVLWLVTTFTGSTTSSKVVFANSLKSDQVLRPTTGPRHVFVETTEKLV